MKKYELQEIIDQSEMVLIGIGNEMSAMEKNSRDIISADLIFNQIINDENEKVKDYNKREQYMKAWQNNCDSNNHKEILNAYHNLYEMIKNKNYFIITTNMDDQLKKTEFNQDRIVSPCGGYQYLQCENNCNNQLIESDTIVNLAFATIEKQGNENFLEQFPIPKCSDCNADLVFCNKDALHYNEAVYLKDWEKYTKWMQGTMNRKVCIIELGEGLQFPSVIRWPFEKMAFINQKSTFIRIHSKLYQLSEEISEKGHSIDKNPIYYLLNK